MKFFIRKLTKKSRYSYFVSVPKELVKKFNWKERQKLKLTPRNRKKSIEIKDWEK